MKTLAIHQCDGYKTDHRRQYPANTIKVYTNFTPRKSRVSGQTHVINFGLTGFIKEFLLEEFNESFFHADKAQMLKRYARRMKTYLPGNDMTFEHIEALHDLGYLPIKIKALPEGALVPCGVPVLTITNTLPEFFWLPNFLETILSTEVWQMSTSATTAYQYRCIFDKYALLSSGTTAFSSSVQAHDFSFRGQVARQAAIKSGAAHLTAFIGSDTIPSIDYLEDYYNANSDLEVVAISVPATEHSVMCMGQKESEKETIHRLISELYPKGFISIVADTWDFWNVVRPKTGLLAQLHNEIMAREGTLVARPDSGDPVLIITGYCGQGEAFEYNGKYYAEAKRKLGGPLWDDPNTEISREEYIGAVQCLWEEFGGTTNEKGYKQLDSHIGLIYGDSITLDRATSICERLLAKGFASTNWVAGVGSYTYQYVTRDTFGWAMKATYGELEHAVSSVLVSDGACYAICDDGYGNGQIELLSPGSMTDDDGCQVLEEPISVIEPREIFKDPITDDGTKKSAKGLLRVDLNTSGEYYLTDQVTEDQEQGGELVTVFEDGNLLVDPILSEIRGRVNVAVAKTIAT